MVYTHFKNADKNHMNTALQTIRKMQKEDIEHVLNIIHEHDEDDAEEAERDYREIGLSGQIVAVYEGQIIGVSGVRSIEGSSGSYKLSWTYIMKAHCGQGHGRRLLNYLFDKVQQSFGRKIFVYVSDYVDDNGVAIYAAALKLYQSMGFIEEATVQNYYDTGESLTVLSLVLQQADAEFNEAQFESPKIAFEQLFPVAETEHTYSVSWKIKSFGGSFTAADLKPIIEAAYEAQAHLILIAFPSNFENVSMPLFEAGFSQSGQLKDYYQVGVHEDHFIFRV